MRIHTVRRTLAAEDRRGSALVVTTLFMTTLAILSFGLLALSDSTHREQRGSKVALNAAYVSEAGIAAAILRMREGDDPTLGSQQGPVALGGGGFWVTATDLGGGLTQLSATGLDLGAGAVTDCLVREIPNTIWMFGAFGETGLTMDSNAQVDSFDSTEGDYASQAVNGSGSDLHANTNGDVGSNGTIDLDSNVKVWGDATPGPGETVDLGPNVVLSGSTAPMPEAMVLDPIVLPVLPTTGALEVPGGSVTVASGSYHYTALNCGSNDTVTIVGPATLVFDSFDLDSGSQFLIDNTNGPVEMYVINDFTLNSNTLIATLDKNPLDFSLNLLSDNIINPGIEVDLDEVDFESNAKLYGTIYAPDSMVEINSNFELYGAVIAEIVHLDSNSKIHFDEALLEADEDAEIVLEKIFYRVRPLAD
ncbi:MAG TPA: hypothetical protein VJP77_01620 [Planctomycetota bacterium]|nr:hypothetical protein [Planctomycetota bacterium]